MFGDTHPATSKGMAMMVLDETLIGKHFPWMIEANLVSGGCLVDGIWNGCTDFF